MSYRLLVDSDAFVESFSRDVSQSRRSVYIQVMTFEADAAGRTIVDVLQRSPAPDKRLLVDRYIELMISDRLHRSPRNRRDPILQREVSDTFEFLRVMPSRGVRTRLANPLGPLLLRAVARDHIKVYVIDRCIAYIGGLNISDHNFAWHDCMLRIENEDVAGFLSDRFLDSWDGRPTSGRFEFGDLELVFFDGRSNREMFGAVTGLVDKASDSIWIQSPYVSFPLFGHLRRAVGRGVHVEAVSPGRNNKPLMDNYTAWEAKRSGVHLHHLPHVMTHLKACLIDGRELLLGSSNLDYLSTTVQRELIAIVRNQRLIGDFVQRVKQVDMKASVPWDGSQRRGIGRASGILMRAAVSAAAAASRIASAIDHPRSPVAGGSAR